MAYVANTAKTQMVIKTEAGVTASGATKLASATYTINDAATADQIGQIGTLLGGLKGNAVYAIESVVRSEVVEE